MHGGNSPKWANNTHIVLNDQAGAGVFIIDYSNPASPVIPTTHAMEVGASDLTAGGDRYAIFRADAASQGIIFRSWNVATISHGCLPRLSANAQFAYVVPYQAGGEGEPPRFLYLNDNTTPIHSGTITDVAITNSYVSWIRNNVLYYRTIGGTTPIHSIALEPTDGHLNMVEDGNARPYIVLATDIGVDVFAANATVGWRIDTSGQSFFPAAVMVGNTIQIAFSNAHGGEAVVEVDVNTSTNASMLSRPNHPVPDIVETANWRHHERQSRTPIRHSECFQYGDSSEA